MTKREVLSTLMERPTRMKPTQNKNKKKPSQKKR